MSASSRPTSAPATPLQPLPPRRQPSEDTGVRRGRLTLARHQRRRSGPGRPPVTRKREMTLLDKPETQDGDIARGARETASAGRATIDRAEVNV